MIRVMIIDHSPSVRAQLGEALRDRREILVTGTASDPRDALERMQRQWPDVLLLDIESPDTDSVTFLRQMMSRRPTATVVLTSFREGSAEACLHALDAGALGVIAKPDAQQPALKVEQVDELLGAVRAAAVANLRQVLYCRPLQDPAAAVRVDRAGAAPEVIVLGTRTGGAQALERLLPRLPAHTPPLVIVLQMPERFTRHYAERLDQRCALEVREARHGDVLRPGLALIAPGARHLVLERVQDGLRVALLDQPRLHAHRPSIDVLFRSAAEVVGEGALGALLTGMGRDGVSGLQSLRDAGARTLVQDEASSVVFDTAAEAIRQEAAQQWLSLDELPSQFLGCAHAA